MGSRIVEQTLFIKLITSITVRGKTKKAARGEQLKKKKKDIVHLFFITLVTSLCHYYLKTWTHNHGTFNQSWSRRKAKVEILLGNILLVFVVVSYILLEIKKCSSVSSGVLVYVCTYRKFTLSKTTSLKFSSSFLYNKG